MERCVRKCLMLGAFVLVWFGPPPGWAALTLRSMSWNEEFRFLIFTDQPMSDWEYGEKNPNVQFRYLNASMFSRLARRRTAVETRLQHGYKLCDWRMAYGEIFATWLRQFDFWGWVDFDVVLGRLAFFGFNSSALERRDVVGEFGWPAQGPLTLLRNRPDVNRLWRKLPDIAARLKQHDIQRLNEWAFGRLLWKSSLERLPRPFPTQLSASSRHGDSWMNKGAEVRKGADSLRSTKKTLFCGGVPWYSDGDIIWSEGRLWHLPSCGEAGYLHFSRWKAAFEGMMSLPTGQAVQLGPRGAKEPSETAWAQLERCRRTEAGARFAWDWDDRTPETAFFAGKRDRASRRCWPPAWGRLLRMRQCRREARTASIEELAKHTLRPLVCHPLDWQLSRNMSSEDVAKVVMCGLPRCGKTSISKVVPGAQGENCSVLGESNREQGSGLDLNFVGWCNVIAVLRFQKLSPHESLFLESGIKLETFTIVHNALLRLKDPLPILGNSDQHARQNIRGLAVRSGIAKQTRHQNAIPQHLTAKACAGGQLVDFPGNLLLDDSLSLHPLDASVFSGPCAVVLVIDAQQEEAYTTSVTRARRVIEFACKRNPDVTFDVLLHKVDGAKFYTDGRVFEQRKEECKKAVEDKLTEDMSDKEKASISFHCTSIYDHTVFEAFSQVVQKLIPERPTLEKCLEAEKAYLFDVVSKLYLAADKSNSELSWYELCADMVDVVIDIACRFTEAKAALASAWKQHGPSIGEAVLHQEVEDLRWRMGLPPLSDCSMGPSDWLLGAPDAQACLGRDCSSIDFLKFDTRTIFLFIVSVAAASALGAFGLTYTWTRTEDQSDELPDWPQGPARNDGVWTLQPQWQEPLEADNPRTYHEDAEAEIEGANEATATARDPDSVFESGLDSFLGEEFEPLALAGEHVSTPEPSPPQNAAVVGLTVAPIHLPLPAASAPPLHPQPSVPTGALQIPLNRLLPPLPLPDTSAARARAHSEEWDLDGRVRSFPATPEWSNVWFAGPEGPRRALTESQLIPNMASGFPGSGAAVAGWPRQISHIHEPVEELHERPEMESELHRGVMNSVQQLLEDEAPEWAGPADPVVQSSQWGFSCPGRWADAVAEDVYAPETAWFEPQRSSSVGHAVEPKQRSRRRSKRHKQTAPEHTGPLGGESTESTIRVLQLEQLLMLDERIPSFQEPTPAPVGKQPRRATSQPPMSAKAKPQSRPRPQRDPKAKARAPLHTQSQRRPSKQSLQSQPETQRKEAQRRPGNPKASKADGWRSGQESEWSRHVTHARSPEGPNPEAVPQGLAALAPEHVGQERPQARLNSEARGSRSHPIRNQVTDSRRRPRSRPKMPTSSALPQRSGRAWRAGRRSSESDPAPGLDDNKDAGCEFQLHNGAVLVLKEVGHCLALVCVFQGHDACFDRQELLEHNVEVFKEALNKICPVHLPKPRPQLAALTFGSCGVGAKPAAAPPGGAWELRGHDNWEASVRVRCAFTALQAVTSLCRFPDLEVAMSESIEGLLRPACLLVQSLHPAYEQAVILADDGGKSEEEGGVAPFVAQTMELIQAMAVRVKLKPLLKNRLKNLLQLLVPFMRITENQAASWRADPNECASLQEEDEHCRGCTIRVSGEGLVGQMLDSFKREASRAVAALATDLLERGEAGRSSGDAAAWKLTEVGLFVFSIAVGEATVKSLQRSELGPLVPDTLQLAARLCADRNASEFLRARAFSHLHRLGDIFVLSRCSLAGCSSLGQSIVAKDQALGSKAAATQEGASLPQDSPWDALRQSEALYGEAGSTWRVEEAGRILNSNALETLQTWFQPAADGLDSETSDGVDDALAGLLKDEVPYVVEFLSDKQFPGPICRAFWQSELYLRDFQQVAGQAPLEEFTQTAKHVTDKMEDMIQDGSEMPQALDRLVTRQQFGAAARFGYFLRRAKQRLRLESIMTGPVGTLETYVAEMSAQQQVELVRAASREASSAIDVRATALFGKASELLRGVAVGEVSPLPLSSEGRVRLAVEAVAFGASLFDAEDCLRPGTLRRMHCWARIVLLLCIDYVTADFAKTSMEAFGRAGSVSLDSEISDGSGEANESASNVSTSTTRTTTSTSTVPSTSTSTTSTSTLWQATAMSTSSSTTSATRQACESHAVALVENTTSTYTTNTSTTSRTTSTATLSTLSTTTTTTTVHVVTLTGVILTQVSTPSRFLSDAQVPLALARAMATLTQARSARRLHAHLAERGGCQAAVKPLRADAEFVKHRRTVRCLNLEGLYVAYRGIDSGEGTSLRIAFRQLQADSGAVEIATTLQGPNATERAEVAKQLLIHATPAEIAELMSSEVNGLQMVPYSLEVLEVAPPTITGRAVQVSDHQSSEGIVFDTQDMAAGTAPSPGWPSVILIAAVIVREEIPHLLEAAAKSLGPDEPLVVRVSACRVFCRFLTAMHDDKLREDLLLKKGVLSSLGSLLRDADEDLNTSVFRFIIATAMKGSPPLQRAEELLHLCLECLCIIVKQCPTIMAAVSHELCPLTVQIWRRCAADPMVHMQVLDLVSCCISADPKLQSAMEDSSFGSECTTFVKGVSGLSPRVKWPALLEKCCHAASLPLSLHGLPRPKLGKESLLPVVANDLQPGSDPHLASSAIELLGVLLKRAAVPFGATMCSCVAPLVVKARPDMQELSSKLNAGKLRGPASALEALRLARTEDSDKRALDKPTPDDEPQKEMNFTAALPEEQPEEKHVFAANPEEAEMQKVVAAEAEMEEESKALHKKAKKEKSELSNTLRRKSQKAEYFDEGFWYRIARHPLFELVFACCIMGHAILMAAELQYRGVSIGYSIGYPHFTQSAEQAMPGAKTAFDVLEWTFGILFMVEAAIKLWGLRCSYFQETWHRRCWGAEHAFAARPDVVRHIFLVASHQHRHQEVWNWFDFALVWLWIADRLLENLPFDTSLLRLLRLARLLRLVKLARTVQGFDALAVMTTSLYGSVHALIWVAALLILVQMTFSLLLSQVLLFYVEDDAVDLADRQVVFEYFGNFTRSILSMFEITLGNWPPIARILQEKVSSWFVVFSLLHKIVFGFACVAVINGVFMQETFKVAQQDDQIMLRTVETKRMAHRKKMQMFFQHANDDDDKVLSPEEWREVLAEEKVKHWFAAQGLSISDPDLLWDILDTSGDRELDLEELIQGTARLQGPARSLDLAVLKMEHYRTLGAVKDIRTSVDMLRQQMNLLVRNSLDVERSPSQVMEAGLLEPLLRLVERLLGPDLQDDACLYTLTEQTMAAVRLLTFNIWFAAHEMRSRMEAIAKIIDQKSPDLIALQDHP
eukprot:s109_g28.t8